MSGASRARRREDWPLQLEAVIDAARGRAYAPGEHDCVTFAAAVIEAMTGARPAFTVDWSDARSMLRRIESEGGLERAVTARLGDPLDAPAFAQRGDVVLYDAGAAEVLDEHGAPARPALGICLGAHFAAPARGGLAFLPMTRALRAWRA